MRGVVNFGVPIKTNLINNLKGGQSFHIGLKKISKMQLYCFSAFPCIHVYIKCSLKMSVLLHVNNHISGTKIIRVK